MVLIDMREEHREFLAGTPGCMAQASARYLALGRVGIEPSFPRSRCK